jgi:histidinol-phosphatase (PHP family)
MVEAGVPFTFSSDAHAPAEVGSGYEKTVPLARSLGVTEFLTFEKRRRIARPLPGARSIAG